ncbi:MAG: ABC transporter ATP-binding protein [Thermoprotei archaeon]|nr:MAG: ABC transporter ATP-binding protein [Thermoprotei archaeon]
MSLGFRETFSKLWKMLPDKHEMIVAMILLCINSVIGIITPYLLKIAIDVHIASRNWNGLLTISLIYALLIVVQWISSSISSYLISKVGQEFGCFLRKRAFQHIARMRYHYFEEFRTGDLISRVINDTATVRDVFLEQLTALVGSILSISGSLVLMLKLSIRLTLAFMTTVPLMIIVTYKLVPRFMRAFKNVREKISDVTVRVQEAVAGAQEIQAFGREKDMIHEFQRVTRDELKAKITVARMFMLYMSLMQFIGGLSISILLAYGGYLVIGGWLTIGTLAAFMSYGTSFITPLRTIIRFYNSFQEAIVALDRVYEVLHVPIEEDRPDSVEVDKLRGEIIFEHVTFRYPNGIVALKDINLHVKPGEKIAIVGPSGAGKSTLVSLICKFYEPTEGRILVDGIDIRKIKLRSLRKNVGLVLQETYLFSGTVRDNIKMANPNATDEDVERVCKELGIHDYIMALPNGYDTEVGEGGIRLSAGQRQLIAIARAMLKDPPIIILDEALSNVDPGMENFIVRTIKRLLKGRTAIIIAHRFTSAMLADRIIVLDNGRIVEEGTHEELMRRKGMYYRLYMMQAGEVKAVATEK